MNYSINSRNAKFYIILLLGIIALLISQTAVQNSSQPVSADGGDPVQFDPFEQWSVGFSDARDWNTDPSYWETIQYPDVDGDGLFDVCGRGDIWVYCAPSTGVAFEFPLGWDYHFSDSQGWNSHDSYWSTIQFPDVNGDGRSDICGRSSAGIICGLSEGDSFATPSNWNTSFSDASGWKDHPSYWETIQFPDLNGDGKDDICGRASDGLNCGLSDGQAFVNVTVWDDEFSNANGWNNDPSYWQTIQFPDISGDGRADVCGRFINGLYCGWSNGVSFIIQTYFTDEYGDNTGWDNDPAYWATIQYPDINGDGLDDVCGRAVYGIYCAISLGIFFEFEPGYWESNFSDANGWHLDPSYWGTIQFPDINGDGMDDVCGRAVSGMYCSISNGAAHVGFSNWQPALGDAGGWNADPSYWATIQFPEVSGDGMADVCGRAASGIYCGPAALDDNPPPPPNSDFRIYLPFSVK